VKETLTETAEPVLDTCEEGHGLVNARAAGGDQDGATDIDDKDDDKDAPDREATADNETLRARSR